MTGRTIVTEWFRVPRVWPLLARSLARIREPVTVWTGACGTGEEAWSAAMLLLEYGIPGRVLATDIDEANLEVARRGTYPADSLQAGGLTAARIEAFFEPAREGGARVRPPLRDVVRFGVLDLERARVPACHAALLRNVWRHLSERAQRRLAAATWHALAPGGRLLLGGGDLLDAELRHVRPVGLERYFAECHEHSLVWRPRHDVVGQPRRPPDP